MHLIVTKTLRESMHYIEKKNRKLSSKGLSTLSCTICSGTYSFTPSCGIRHSQAQHVRLSADPLV